MPLLSVRMLPEQIAGNNQHKRKRHQLSLTEAKEICEKEITSNELEMYRDDGTIYRKRLGLSPDKLQIVKI